MCKQYWNIICVISYYHWIADEYYSANIDSTSIIVTPKLVCGEHANHESKAPDSPVCIRTDLSGTSAKELHVLVVVKPKPSSVQLLQFQLVC